MEQNRTKQSVLCSKDKFCFYSKQFINDGLMIASQNLRQTLFLNFTYWLSLLKANSKLALAVFFVLCNGPKEATV